MKYYLHIVIVFMAWIANLSTTQANVFYRDIADQTISVGNSLFLDMTGDGNTDVAIAASFSGGAFFIFATPTTGSVGTSNVQVQMANPPLLDKLSNGVSIGAGNPFAVSSSSSCTACIQNAGMWVGGATNIFIGIRFTLLGAGTTHYGWIRIDVNNTVSTLTVKDCAYEQTPNQAITTGYIPIGSIDIQGQGGTNAISTDDGNLQIQANLLPSNASNTNLSWSVDNPIIASIDGSGRLSAHRNGSVLVQANTQDDSGLSDTVRIFLSNQIVPVERINVSSQNTSNSITTLGGSLQLLSDILPTVATNQNITWSVDSLRIATISNTGVLTAKENGQVVVVATSQDNSRVSGAFVVTITGQPIPITSLLIQGTNSISSAYGTIQFTTSITPSNASNSNITWSIDNDLVASIDANGLLTALGNGTVLVRASTQDGSNISNTVSVSISNQVIKIQSLSVQGQLGQTSINALHGQLPMQATISPSNATNPNLLWQVNNPMLASISPDGVLTALRNGTVTVSAYAQDGTGVVGTASIVLSNQVLKLDSIRVQAQSGGNIINAPFDTLQMQAFFFPNNATNQNIVWAIDSPQIALIDTHGILTPLRNGQVQVRAISQDGSGIVGIAIVTITNQPILINNLFIQGQAGQSNIAIAHGTLQMIANILPANASNTNLVWRVDNTSFAVINQAGQLTALRNGSVTVTAYTQDGSGVTASSSISISNQPVPINALAINSMRGTNFINLAQDTMQLTVNVNPLSASNQAVFWSVNNPMLARVSDAGLITALGNGIVTVTATAQDGSGIYGTFAITISSQLVKLDSISIAGQGGIANINIPNGTLQLVPSFFPISASHQTVFWAVDSPQIATISPSGMLTAHANGTVRIIGRSTDGTFSTDFLDIAVSNQNILTTNLSIQGRGGMTTISSPSDTLQLIPIFTPSNVSNTNLDWTANNPSIAMINNAGLLTAVSDGVATITATTQDGSGMSAIISILISNQLIYINGVSISGNGGVDSILNPYDTLQMTSSTIPLLPTYPNLTWTVSPSNLARITTLGSLVPFDNGTVTVTAASQDGSGMTATQVIHIANQPILTTALTVQGQAGVSNINTPLGTLQMEGLFSPAIVSNAQLSWTIDNPTLAQIDQMGVLTALRDGIVVVTATTQDGSGIAASASISLTGQDVLLDSLDINPFGGIDSIVLAGGTLQLLPTLYPSTPTNSSLVWTIVGGTGWATIDATGLLTAVSDGMIVVRASSQDAAQVYDELTIFISNQFSIAIPVLSISTQGQAGANTISTDNGHLQMEYTIVPAVATNQQVIWSVDNTSIATIDNGGILTAQDNGTVRVYVTAVDNGMMDSVDITISNQFIPLSSLSIQGGSTNISTPYGSILMPSTITPANASIPSLAWSSGNTAMATVDGNGVVRAWANGTVMLYGKAQDGTTLLDSVSITINNQLILITNITLTEQNGSSAITTAQGSLVLSAAILPTNATNASLVWTSNNPFIANVSKDGIVTAIDNGSAVITANSLDGSGIVQTFLVTCSNQKIIVSFFTVQGQAGQNFINTPYSILQMEAQPTPSNATNSSVVWSVDNPSIAVIYPNGKLHALANGVVTVFAASQDGSGVSNATTISVSNQPILMSSLSINTPSTNITTPYGVIQVSASYLPSNASNPTILWAINNPLIASISKNGIITAHQNGTATIYALAQDSSGVVDSFSLTISNQPILLSSLTISAQGGASTISTEYGSLQMLNTIAPLNATNPSFAWSVDNPTIASITPAGILTALGTDGVVLVTARAQDGSGISNSYSVSISNQPILVSSISLQGQGGATSINAPFASLQMLASVLPSNASNTSIAWSVSNPSLATITPSGLLIAHGSGTISVIARAQDGSGIVNNINISLNNQFVPVSNVAIQGQGGASTINTPNGTLQILATLSPINPTYTNVFWSVNNPNIATIDILGRLYAKNNGIVLVTATALDGSNKSDTLTITISNQPIYVNDINVQGQSGQTAINVPFGLLQMQATILPSNASNLSIHWTMSPLNIASINNAGQLRALKNGTVRVYAWAIDGSQILDSADISLSNQPILLNTLSVNGTNGVDSIVVNNGTLQLLSTFTPANATNTNLHWTVSNPSLATISHTGLLTAKNNGTVIAQLHSQDGSNIIASFPVQLSNQTPSSLILVRHIDLAGAAGQATISNPNGTLQILETIFPANASNTDVTWSVSDLSLASIDNFGVLQARANGTVYVFATSQDGSKVSGILPITLTNQPVSISIIPTPVSTFTCLVYPNPFTSFVQLELDAPKASAAIVVLYNQLGAVVYQTSLEVLEGKNTYTIPYLDNLPSAMYWLQVLTPDGKVTKGIVKE